MRSLDWISLCFALPLAIAAACSSGKDTGATAAQTSSSSASGSGGSGGSGGAGPDQAASVTSTDSSSTPGSAVSTGTFGAGGARGAGCGDLASNVLALLDSAQKCALGGPLMQCADIVGGLCCPVLVANKDSQQSNAYEQALLSYQMSGCKFECPPMPCDFTLKGVCSPDSPNSGNYHCSPQ